MPQLYDLEPYSSHFSAEVLAQEGSRILLSQTLFYPEGGGQNADTGTLEWDGTLARVTGLDKLERQVWHTLEGAVPAVGTVLEGRLDWARRYRHMQRHSAEHLLAQAFVRVNPAFRVQAVGMRSPECTLDFEGDPSEHDALEATRLWMEVAYRNLPIRAFEVPYSDLERYPLRRAPKVRGQVRLVVVEDDQDPSGFWEVSACGGTHLARTAEAGPLLIHRLERVKGGLTRVVFSAGWEAFEQLSATHRNARALAQGFSSGLPQLASRVEGLREEHALLRRTLEDSRLENARHRVHQTPALPFHTGTLRVLETETPELMQPMVKVLGSLERCVGLVSCGGRIAVISTLEGVKAGDVLKELLEQSGGKGGGKPDLAQGQADPERLNTAVQAFLRSSVHSEVPA